MAFRDDFFWGSATAAFQIEGAAFENGKGRSIWDEFSHREGTTYEGHTGDVACDHYHKFKEDIKLMAQMGLKAYRFSFSWPRIIPNGTGEINPDGIRFYNELIDELIKNGITPFATLFHWDLPFALHTKGGWLNDDISDWFNDYAKVIAENFGDRLKNFITFNEPQVFIGCGYKIGVHAPGLKECDENLLHMSHNVLLSHGKATKTLRELVPDCSIGFTSSSFPRYPANDIDDERITNHNFSCSRENFIFTETMWFDPIVFGKYPQKLLDECKDIFPEPSKEDMDIISQPIDFIGMNIYQGMPIVINSKGEVEDFKFEPGFPRNTLRWRVTPGSMYWGPRLMYERYGKSIYITECGMCCHDTISLDGKVHDPNRIDYLNRYLLELRRAATDNVDIRGFFYWSLLDNFEWSEGYNERFGLIFVDYKNQNRILKDSAAWYTSVIEKNGENL